MPGTFPGVNGQSPVRDDADSSGYVVDYTTAKKVRETGGPTDLTAGVIADGTLLVRSGSSIVGDTHKADQAAGVHGSTASATASKLVHRDASGRSQVADPSVAADIATKGYVDTEVLKFPPDWINLPLFTHDGTNIIWSHSGMTSFTAANVNDGDFDVAAFHMDSAGSGSWVKVNLGSGNSKTFRGVLVTCLAVVNGRFSVQYSDDDSAWTTVYPKALSLRGGAALAEWRLAGSHRYWRLLKADVATQGGHVNEIQFFE